MAAADRDRHPWLFEHGRRRNLRTFLATYVRSALPRRFWRRVTPANPVNVRRLLAYWAVTAAVVVAYPAYVAEEQVRGEMVFRASFVPVPGAAGVLRSSAYGEEFTPAQFAKYAPPPWSLRFWTRGLPIPMAGVVFLVWPWLTVASLLVFQLSMRRARVGWPHVVRAAVYGCDFGLLLAAVAGVYIGSSDWIRQWVEGQPRPALMTERSLPICGTAVLCAVVVTYRLTVAYARYLRFDRPALTVLASQAMVALVIAIALVWSA